MITVRQLKDELKDLPDNSEVKIEIEVVEGHEVRVEYNHIERIRFEDEEVIVELG